MDTEEGKRSAEPLPQRGAEWVEPIHSNRMSPRARRCFGEWLAESPEHVRDFESAQRVWRVSADLEELDAFRSELRLLRVTATSRLRAFPVGGAQRRWVATAAAVLLVSTASAWYVRVYAPDTYVTVPGEQRTITPTDGSTIVLNTDTRLRIKYSPRARAVAIDRGEAMFEVVPDAKRPFVVRADRGVIRAVGTSFNVITDGRVVTVTVLDGRVEVATTAPGGTATSTILGAGESTAYDQNGRTVDVDPTQGSAQRILAWRKGRLQLDAWPIARAIREHHRYGGKPIRLSDPTLGQTPIGGVLRIGDAPALAMTIAAVINAEIIDQGDSLLLLTSEPELESRP